MTKERSKFHYAWIILLALSVIVGIGKGAINNSSGLFLPSVTDDLGIGMGKLSLYFSVSAVVTMVFLPIGGKLMAKYDTRYIIAIGILLQGGAFALFGLMSNVWGWYGLAIPLAMGGVFITVIIGPVVINQWFKTRNGLALGILSASGGLFGAIAQPIAAGLIDGLGWRMAYIALGIATIVIIVPVALFLMKRSPQAHGVQPYGVSEETSGNGSSDQKEEGIDVAVAKKSSALYMLMLFFFFITSIASFSMHIPKHLENIGFDVKFSGNVMGTFMLGILIGSLILGYLVDKLGSKRTAVGTMIAGIFAMITLIAADENAMMITIAVGVFGLVSSSIGIIAPSLTTSLFGKKSYSEIYATASMGLAISSIIAMPAYGFVYDAFNSYIPVLYALIIMLAVNIIWVLLAFTNKKKLVAEGYWTK